MFHMDRLPSKHKVRSYNLAQTVNSSRSKPAPAQTRAGVGIQTGATTHFFVLASQADYVSAESNLVNQIINYRRNEINLLQRTGQLLEERGIVLQP